MAETTPPKRISKVATELNISSDRVIDFLVSKGFSGINPNTKLTDDMYLLLLKEFQSEAAVLEESKRISQNRIKRESIALDDKVNSKNDSDEDEIDGDLSELLIKNVNVPSQKPVIVEQKEQPKPEPLAETVEPAIEKNPEPEVIEAIEPTQKSEITEEADVKEESSDTGGIKVVGKIDLKSLDKKSKHKKEKEKEVVESVVETPKVETPKVETPSIIDEAEKVEATTEVKETETPTQDKPVEVIKAKAEKLEGVRVLRTIELPVDPPKKQTPVGSSTGRPQQGNNNERQKRKRISKDVGTPIKPERVQGAGNVGSNNNRPQHGHRAPVQQPSEDEIQKQIKETLQRLSAKGGKSKTSKNRRNKREEIRAAQENTSSDLENRIIKVTEFVTVNDLAKLMDVSATEVITTCMQLGLFVSINQRLDAETLVIVAEEFGFKVEFVSVDVQEAIKEEEDKPEQLKFRSPIVTVMGHVDHGKTSLLDYIRKANVIAGEAGGITQHIGAYNVKTDSGKEITFLDTPGHEAFTAMRARGAQVTDVVIVVVAADDSVMPQTVEAINHAQAAGVPIIFAINKIDKPNANPDKIREQLANMNILVEEWGGKYQSQEISAKQGKNVDLLLEKVLIEAELLDLKANPEKNASGTIIESSLDKGRGYLSTLLVQNGTLKIGDVILAGCYSGRVKALFNERGVNVKEAGPSKAALMLGLNGAPPAGDKFNVMEDEREARDIANKRLQLQREQGIRTQKHITLDEIGRRIAIGDFKELNIIVKGDVDGSIEALSDALLKLSTEKIQINIIHKSVGQVTESDIMLASASNAIIVGFQVRPSASARKLAEAEQIDVRFYSVIYAAIDEIKAAMEGMLAPEFEEKVVCNIEIRETFKISKIGTIAGCMVLDGKVNRNTKIRLIRDGIVLHTGTLASLKRFKDDVKEVSTGYECGLNINNFNDIQVGDIIEGYEMVEIKKKL